MEDRNSCKIRYPPMKKIYIIIEIILLLLLTKRPFDIPCRGTWKLYFILYSETQCISKLDKIGIFIDMKFH